MINEIKITEFKTLFNASTNWTLPQRFPAFIINAFINLEYFQIFCIYSNLKRGFTAWLNCQLLTNSFLLLIKSNIPPITFPNFSQSLTQCTFKEWIGSTRICLQNVCGNYFFKQGYNIRNRSDSPSLLRNTQL